MLRHTFRQSMPAMALAATLVGNTLPIGSALYSQERPSTNTADDITEKTNKEKTSKTDKTTERQAEHSDFVCSTLGTEHADDHSPTLGVIVGSCPGNAVCVKDTLWGSPAAEADIRQGDYILSVDGQQVSSPWQLKEILTSAQDPSRNKANESPQANPRQDDQRKPEAEKKPDSPQRKRVKLTIWRHGEQLEKSVELATVAGQLPESHRAWLGVMLSASDAQDGVVIEAVMPESPAEKAGLEAGDRITLVNEREATDVKSFVECVEDKGPGSQMTLAIVRDGNPQTIDVTLGDVRDAPMAFLRNALEPWMDDDQSESNTPRFRDSWSGIVESTVEQLRQELRELRSEVRELRKEKQKDEDDSQSRRVEPAKDVPQDVRLDNKTDENDFILAQRRGQPYDWNDRGRNWSSNRYPYGNAYRYNYGGNRGWPTYRAPLGRNPYYDNYYYRYGGTPYYYGGRSSGITPGLGLRSGLQLGRSLGLWY